jgi:HPt (histidine-containing phosphotransfer) domain-containing protein
LHYAKNLPILARVGKAAAVTADPRRAALAELDRAVAALAPHMVSADDQAALARLQTEVMRLCRPANPGALGLRDFDPTRFQRLIDLTGPAMAGTLLLHLADDLSRCRSLALSGAADQDWDALREGSHILISLAGSAGALSLQAMAEALNTAAHAQDDAASREVVPGLVAELDALIALVRATPVPAGGAA